MPNALTPGTTQIMMHAGVESTPLQFDLSMHTIGIYALQGTVYP